MDGVILFVLILAWLGGSGLVAIVAYEKGRGASGWALGALLLFTPLLALIALAALPALPPERSERLERWARWFQG